jgi:hypothetical protein
MNLQKPSCLRCSRYLTCRNPGKAQRFHCDEFKQLKAVASILELDELDLIPPGETTYEDEPEVDLSTHRHLAEKKDVTKARKRKLDEIDSFGSANTAEGEAVEYGDSVLENGKGEDFVWHAMRKAFDPETNTVRDLKIDDSALPLAKNYYDFCTNIAGKAIKSPFARQLWIAYNLLSEFCPRCTPTKYGDINNIPVDMDSRDLARKVTLLVKGKCPKCGITKSELILGKELLDYNQLVMIAGQRGGKSAFSATITGYHTHLILKAPRLSTMCRGIQDFTPLTGTFVALTTGRAIKLLWNPFHTLVSSSEWFSDYFKLLDHYGRQYGKEFYKKRDLFIRFFHKNLDYYPMGPMKRTLRGDTRIIANVDELGWFPYKDNPFIDPNDEDGPIEGEGDEDEREMANGDEVHQALDNSLSTMRAEVYQLYKQNINTVPTGLNVNISSPQSWKDKICRLYKESADPATLSLGIHLPTWDINPLYTRDHPIIMSAYAKNPRRAERDFGANPPRLSETMFVQQTLRASFRGKQHHTIIYDDDNPEFTVGVLKSLVERASWKAGVMGIDAGLVNNSFALSIGTRDESVVTTNSVIELIPSNRKPVHFPAVYKNIILPIVKQCNIVFVGADRWNSVHLLQQITEDTGGRTKTMHVTLNERDFMNYKALVNAGNQVLPAVDWKFDLIEDVRNYRNELKNRPLEHLYLQYVTVQLKSGAVVKGEGFTDDLFRANVVMATMFSIPKVREHVAKFPDMNREGFSQRAVVMIGGRSGGTYVSPHGMLGIHRRPEG